MSAKWIVEFEVSDNWIADGFDLNDEQAQEMLSAHLPYAYESEVKARVVKRPSSRQMSAAYQRHAEQGQ